MIHVAILVDLSRPKIASCSILGHVSTFVILLDVVAGNCPRLGLCNKQFGILVPS